MIGHPSEVSQSPKLWYNRTGKAGKGFLQGSQALECGYMLAGKLLGLIALNPGLSLRILK